MRQYWRTVLFVVGMILWLVAVRGQWPCLKKWHALIFTFAGVDFCLSFVCVFFTRLCCTERTPQSQFHPHLFDMQQHVNIVKSIVDFALFVHKPRYVSKKLLNRSWTIRRKIMKNPRIFWIWGGRFASKPPQHKRDICTARRRREKVILPSCLGEVRSYLAGNHWAQQNCKNVGGSA